MLGISHAAAQKTYQISYRGEELRFHAYWVGRELDSIAGEPMGPVVATGLDLGSGRFRVLVAGDVQITQPTKSCDRGCTAQPWPTAGDAKLSAKNGIASK